MIALSVLMPVRDGARHLEAAIGSILGQGFRDFEFLIVDDGSEDATPSLLARAAAQDGRIRLLRQPPSGIVAALNAGLGASTAPWVARMDADDIAHPERLARQMQAAMRWPRAAGIGSAWRVMREEGVFRRTITPPQAPEAVAAALRHHNPLAHPTMLLRREAVLGAGLYREAFRGVEDYDLWLRLAERHELRALPEALLDYREHEGQTAWAETERRVLLELATRASAAARRAGRPDPADGVAVLDRAWLRAAGVAEAEITATLTSRALGTARDALAAGQGRAARAALRLLRAQPGLRARTRLHARLLWVRSLTTGRPR